MYEKTFIREHSLLKHNQFDYIIDETWLFRIFVIVDMRLPLPVALLKVAMVVR